MYRLSLKFEIWLMVLNRCMGSLLTSGYHMEKERQRPKLCILWYWSFLWRQDQEEGGQIKFIITWPRTSINNRVYVRIRIYFLFLIPYMDRTYFILYVVALSSFYYENIIHLSFAHHPPQNTIPSFSSLYPSILILFSFSFFLKYT